MASCRHGGWQRVWWMVAFALGVSFGAHADAQPAFDVSEPPTGQALGLYLGILEDVSGALTVEQVASADYAQKFQASTSRAPGLGLKTTAHWVRLTIRNRAQSARPWLLELGYPNTDTVDLYIPNADGGYQVRRTGDQRVFSTRDIDHRNFVFKLDEPAQAQRTYYLRLHSTGAMSLPFVAWSEDSLREHLNVEQPLLWMFYGLILVMAVYNLFVYLSVRQRQYLFYCLYVLSFLAFQMTINGHTFQYLLPNQPALVNRLLPFFLGITLFWALRFIIHFLSLETVLPWAYRIVLWGGNLSAALALYGFFGSYAISVRGQVLIGVPLNLVMVVVTVILVRRRFRPAQFYALAWSGFMVGVLLYYLRAVGIVPANLVTEWATQLGAAVEVVLLSLALADRINMMRKNLAELNAELSLTVADLRDALRLAEAATQAKGEFMATVSHELRTPLNAIINVPQGLLEHVAITQVATCGGCHSQFELAPDERISNETACPECARLGTLAVEARCEYTGRAAQLADHLGLIERSGKHLLEMVNGILDFSKLEAGRIELRLQTVSLADMVRDVVEPLHQLARGAGVKLELAALPEGATLRADPLRVRQVLINLIGNAIKFSDGRGTVFVSVAQERDAFVFQVRDQGIGIAAQDRDKVFKSFEQLDHGDTRRFGGTGLGLSIAKSLVELHEGEIWVESELGQGAAFLVRLPIAGPHEAAAPLAASA